MTKEDLLTQIGGLLREFDRRFGSQTRAVLTVEKDVQGAPAPPSQVHFDPASGYTPMWGKRIHPIFQPPPPGQTRLAVGAGKRLIFKKPDAK